MNIAKTIKAAVTGDMEETTRLAKRREIKRGLAKRKAIEFDLRALRSDVANIENEISIRTAEHEAAVAELRAKMDSLLEQIAESPSDKLLEKRRGIQQEIANRTKDLEVAVEESKTRVAAVRRLMKPLESQLGDLPIEGALTRGGVANPELETRSFVLEKKVKFLKFRLQDAQQWLRANQAELEKAKCSAPMISQGPYFQPVPGKPDHDAIRLYERRIKRWEAEIAACQSEITEAMAESHACHRAKIEE